MTVLDRLETYSDKWYDIKFSEKNAFLEELALFADTNSDDMYRFANMLDKSDVTTIEIIFQALTKYSTNHFQFIKQIV
ncbi:MAG: hypothetical protein ACK5IC_06515 [Moheibacter sp.]